MSNRLDVFLETIAPESMIVEVRRRIDDAINSFALPGGQVSEMDQFQQLMIRFLIHMEQHLAGARAPRPEMPPYDYARCIEMLDGIYGPSGFRTAFDLARRGFEGGLLAVLRAFAAAFALRVTEASVEPKVSEFCWGLSDRDREEIARAYVQEFGRFLPAEWLEDDGRQVALSLERILTQHPHMLVRLQGPR